MKTSARNREYASIRTMQDLYHQKRLLRSKTDHQEVMIMYRLRNLWDFMSPTRIAVLGLEALATRNRAFGTFYRTANIVTDVLRSRLRRRK